MVQSYQESLQLVAGGAQIDQKVATIVDWVKATNDAVKGTGAPADWFKDEEQAEADADTAAQTSGLMEAAAQLREGAGVAGEVANASVALQQAGLV